MCAEFPPEAFQCGACGDRARGLLDNARKIPADPSGQSILTVSAFKGGLGSEGQNIARAADSRSGPDVSRCFLLADEPRQ